MSAPWKNPAPPERRGFKEFVGRPVLVIVGGVRLAVQTQYGVQDIVHVSLVSLVGADAGNVYTDIHVYTGAITGRLRSEPPGGVVLCKVVEGSRGSASINDPDQWDSNAANSWWAVAGHTLESLKAGAINDFNSAVARIAAEQRGGQQGGYGQQGYGQQQYAQPQTTSAPQAQVQYGQSAQPQFVQPAATTSTQGYPPPPPGVQQQPAQQQGYPPAPPSQQQYAQPPQEQAPAPNGPPATPPPTSYQPSPNPNYAQPPATEQPNGQGSPTLDSMRQTANAGQQIEAPF